MKKTQYLLILGFIFLSAFKLKDTADKKGTLCIKVKGIKELKGKIGILVFNREEGFPNKEEQAVLRKEVKVNGKQMRIDLEDVPFGNYAIAVVHDVNANQLLDKNFLGIPKEPFGFSNTKSIFLGLPAFEEASINFDQAQQETVVELINLN